MPGGVIAVHLSNRHLYLILPTYSVAKHHGLFAGLFRTYPTATPYASEWMLITEDRAFLDSLRGERSLVKAQIQPMTPWTDDHAPLFPIMRGIR